MKNTIISALLVISAMAINANAVSKGSLTDPLYVVSIATDAVVTGDGSVTGSMTIGDALEAGTTTIKGALYIGDVGMSVSTITNLGAATFNGGVSATTLYLSGASELRGEFETGTVGTQSTITVLGAATFPASVTSPAINGTTSITGGAISGTTLTTTGDVKQGAANYVSTFTASSGAYAITGAVTSLSTISGSGLIATSGSVRILPQTLAQIQAKTAVLGDMYLCSDCTPVEVAISTAAGAPNTGGFGNAVGLQLD